MKKKSLRVLSIAMAASLIVVSQASAVFMPQLPPAQYDHPAANMRIWNYSPSKVNSLCRRLVSHPSNPHRASGNGTFYSCAIGGPKQCIVIIPRRSSVTNVSYDALFRHERAHCNGWSH
jgi:hypothetical protein